MSLQEEVARLSDRGGIVKIVTLIGLLGFSRETEPIGKIGR